MYPDRIVSSVVATTGLSQESSLLEIGCGPGTATQSFARLGCSIEAVEPNPEFVRIAKQELQAFDNVTIRNLLFEDYNAGGQKFDVVLAASSFHWVKRDVACLKASQILKPGGDLVLLWNTQLQPSQESFQRLQPIFERHASGIYEFESTAEQIAVLKRLGTSIVESNLFAKPSFDCMQTSVTYSSERFVQLLSSYSPYIALDVERRERLFAEIRDYISASCSDKIFLTYVTGYHIAKVVR